MDSFLSRPRQKKFLVGFVVVGMEMDICFGSVLFLPILHVGELPEFMSLMAMDRSKWPRCLLWHGWLPGLSLAGGRDPWTASVELLASRALERCLGACPADDSGFWTVPDFWDADDLALEMTDVPNPFWWVRGSWCWGVFACSRACCGWCCLGCC